MCGITAVFGDVKKKEEFVKTSLDKVKHRGSSLLEYELFDKGAFGTNRLPIVGRVEGRQPLHNEDETIFAIQNGEIFNYKKLRKDLEKKYHVFKTDCDTEVLVHLYEEYGEKMVDKIDSEMFAFIIYDAKKNNFLVGRDRFGIKPLFYSKVNGNIYFASELKQLSQFNYIDKIEIFPKGHYMINGKLKKYYELTSSNSVKSLDVAKKRLTKLIVQAVKKRVDTDLPIAVLFSGGIDSSLIMEIATRFHKDVTAFILGIPGSPDYEAALRLCKDNNYKYQIVYPSEKYSEEIAEIIYHLELYEAQVIRQSFSLNTLSKAVVRAGYKIALVGDASDEIFAGYNEFCNVRDVDINKGCMIMTQDLEKSHNVRLDRMTMKHTLEVRAPFFDTELVDFAFKIDGKLKVKRENHQIITKYILREVASQFLPDYTTWRYKIAFSNGAGMDVGFNFRAQDGGVAKSILSQRKVDTSSKIPKEYGFITDEEKIYFQIYEKNKYNKLDNNYERIITKDNLSLINNNYSRKKILVAEFGKLPLYYPIYFAQQKEIYKKHNLDVDFISTGGDDLTYNSLFDGSAQIGIADPIFTFAEQKTQVKGKILAQLIGRVPFVAVTLNPNIKINKIDDLKKYKIGTFQKFSTCHTLMKGILPNVDLKPIKYSNILGELKDRKIDIAIVIPEYAYDLAAKGGHIIFTFEDYFKEYLLTGINVADNLDPDYFEAVKLFRISIKESINYIKKNKKEALTFFKKEFPELLNHREILENTCQLWNPKLTITKEATRNAIRYWKKVYPWLLKSNLPQFMEPRSEDRIMAMLCKKKISRDIPYREDAMANIIREKMNHNKPIPLVGFWGASNKCKIDDNDINAVNKFATLNEQIKKVYNKGLGITFILADEHARLNQFGSDKYSEYLKNISYKMKSLGFDVVYLSKLWKEIGFNDKLLTKEIKKLKKSEWSDVKKRRSMENSAKHLNIGDYIEEAKRYYVCRKYESGIIEKKYPNYIFFTHSDDTYQEIFPDLPTVYLWIDKPGKQELPWFNTKVYNKEGTNSR